MKSCEESGIWHTHKSLYSCPFAVSCVRKVWCKFCELQSLFWRSCNWKSLPNSVSSVTQNILKRGQSLFLTVKKIAKFKKAKSLPSFCPPPLPYGSVQTVSAFWRKLCWDTVNYFFVWGTRHQHKLKNTKNIFVVQLCGKLAFILMQIPCMNLGVLGVRCLYAIFLFPIPVLG